MRLFFPEVESDYTIDVCKELAEKYGHEFTHITAAFIAKTREGLQSLPQFKNTKILDSKDFFRVETLRANYQDYFVHLDASILDYFSEIEMDFYNISDRTNYAPLTFRARKRLFRDLIRFWIGYLAQEKIEGVYFACAPHTIWEQVLMQACRYHNIPFFYLSHTAINNHCLLRNRYDHLEPVPANYLKDWTTEQVLADIRPDLVRDFQAESIVTNVVIAENDKANNLADLNTSAAVLNKRVTNQKLPLKQRLKHAIAPLYHLAFSSKERKFYLPMAMDEKSDVTTWMIAKFLHERTAAEFKEWYDTNANADLSKPFVYVPLHLQPELTTQPEAQLFEDHLLLVDTIAKAIPGDWNIYIKENPRQYDTTINTVSAQHFRDISDMQDFLAVSNKVAFIPQSIKTQEILAKAKTVVLLTGTAGWESLNVSKGCITFAHPWYSACRSCLKVRTAEDLRKAFETVQRITAEEVRGDLIRYLHFYQDKMVIGTFADPDNVAYNTLSYREMVEGQAKAMDSYLKQTAAIPYTQATRNS